MMKKFLIAISLISGLAYGQGPKFNKNTDTDQNNSICVDDNGTEKCLTVDGPTGNVGVGTDAPTSGQIVSKVGASEYGVSVERDNDTQIGGLYSNSGQNGGLHLFDNGGTQKVDVTGGGGLSYISGGGGLEVAAPAESDIFIRNQDLTIINQDIFGNVEFCSDDSDIINECPTRITARSYSTTGHAGLDLYYSDGNPTAPRLGIMLDFKGDVGINEDDPQGTLHLGETNGDASLVMEEGTTTPTSPAANTQFKMYAKSNKFIIQWNDGGTTRYYYLDMTVASNQQWTHTTTPP